MALRILVAEDHAPLRHLTCRTLERRPGFQPIEAADGLEALRIAGDQQPDLILLDLNLPKLNGFEVAKRMRALVPYAHVLFMSEESSPEIVRHALSLGARGYIQKADAARDLLSGIDAVLAGNRFVSPSLGIDVLARLKPRPSASAPDASVRENRGAGRAPGNADRRG